jgi:hypothetical protein
LLALLRRPEARAGFFPANFHLFFDNGLDDSINEIGAFLF